MDEEAQYGRSYWTEEIKGLQRIVCNSFSDEGWIRSLVHAPIERELTIYVNLQELVTILCTPTKLNFLVIGFLYAERIISRVGDVADDADMRRRMDGRCEAK